MFRKIIKRLEQIYRLFARFPYSSFFQKYLKYDTSDSKEDTCCGVPLQQICILQANDFSKRTPARFGELFQNWHKEQVLVNSSEKIT